MYSKPPIFVLALSILLLLKLAATAQSVDPNYPTNVTTSEIQGTIRSRDVGDPRLTSYYYTFDGEQGDLFVNVVADNFAGDIDVFAAEGLRPLTKMVFIANGNVNETGRVVYMRKGERLILRVQGRSPNDDAAKFRIKFAGSFVAMAEKNDDTSPTVSLPSNPNEPGVRVNSVGTIVAVIPKPQPTRKLAEPVAQTKPTPEADEVKTPEKAARATAPPVVTVAENIPPAKPKELDVVKPKPAPKKRAAGEPATVFGGGPKAKKPVGAAAVAGRAKRPAAKATKTSAPAKPAPPKVLKPPTPAEAIADPLANIHLVVLFKDGRSIIRPMNEVLKFSVDNGVLTVLTKDGESARYSILEVTKVSIE